MKIPAIIIENGKLLFSKIIYNSDSHETEEMVQVEGRVKDTGSFFMKQATQRPENVFEQLESSD